jgi:hypothetical protein
MKQPAIEIPKAIHHSHQFMQMDLGEPLYLFAGEGPESETMLGEIYNADNFPCLEDAQVEDFEMITVAFADKMVRAYNCHDALIDALQSLVDVAPSEGHRCLYCDISVYGVNDTAEHSPDCELAKAQDILDKAKPKGEPR